MFEANKFSQITDFYSILNLYLTNLIKNYLFHKRSKSFLNYENIKGCNKRSGGIFGLYYP
jgi:hypothetical protein